MTTLIKIEPNYATIKVVDLEGTEFIQVPWILLEAMGIYPIHLKGTIDNGSKLRIYSKDNKDFIISGHVLKQEGLKQHNFKTRVYQRYLEFKIPKTFNKTTYFEGRIKLASVFKIEEKCLYGDAPKSPILSPDAGKIYLELRGTYE